MKQYIISLFILFSFSTIFGQKISMGPEIGVNIIPIENTDLGYNYNLGYHFGGHLKYHFSDHFKLSTGLFLTQKKEIYRSADTSSIFDLYGDLLSFAGVDPDQLDSIAQSFGANTDVLESTEGIVSELLIEVPILANYKYRNFNVYLGPYFSFLLSANKKENTRTQIPLLNVIDLNQLDSTGLLSSFLPAADESSSSSTSSTENLESIDIGFNAGIGYEMNNLHFNLMYSQSFNDYRDPKPDAPKQRLNTFRISMVYLFELKKKVQEGGSRFE